MTQGPEVINAAGVLSGRYGLDSIACHTVEETGVKSAKALFKVGQNLCGPQARPPMFNNISFNGEVATIQTTPDRPDQKGDAWQHFIDKIGRKVVPGHSIAGVTAEFLAQFGGLRYRPGMDFVYIDGFDFLRFKSLVTPGEGITLAGSVELQDNSVRGSLEMGERPFTRNFRVGVGQVLNEADLQGRLEQHWLIEHNAQGLGVLGMKENVGKKIAPVLVEVGKTEFTRTPIFAGDILTSELTIRVIDDRQILGDAVTYAGRNQVADMQKVLLQLVSIEEGGN